MEALIPRKNESHGSTEEIPRSFGSERSGWRSIGRRDPTTRSGALRRVGEQLGINPETLRNWVQQVEVDEGHRPGVTTAEAKQIAELERGEPGASPSQRHPQDGILELKGSAQHHRGFSRSVAGPRLGDRGCRRSSGSR